MRHADGTFTQKSYNTNSLILPLYRFQPEIIEYLPFPLKNNKNAYHLFVNAYID